MEQSLRSSKYVNSPNCSVCQICQGKIYLFQTEIYYTLDPEIDFSEDKVAFYEVDSVYSLNQAPETISQRKTIYLPLNIAFEILDTFKEIEKENEQRISRLFT